MGKCIVSQSNPMAYFIHADISGYQYYDQVITDVNQLEDYLTDDFSDISFLQVWVEDEQLDEICRWEFDEPVPPQTKGTVVQVETNRTYRLDKDTVSADQFDVSDAPHVYYNGVKLPITEEEGPWTYKIID